MSTLHQVSHLSCQILHGGVHWLIYIRIIPGKGIVEIGATDGTQKIYRQSFTWEKFKEAFGNKITDDQIVAKVREGFQKSQLKLTIVGVKLQVIINTQVEFEIYEISASDVKAELAKLLFNFAEKCMDYRNELQLIKSPAVAAVDNSPNSSGKSGTRKRPTVDLTKTSAVNPGTKIRKKATGLCYD